MNDACLDQKLILYLTHAKAKCSIHKVPHDYIDHKTHSFHSNHGHREEIQTVHHDMHDHSDPDYERWMSGELHPHMDYDRDKFYEK